LKLFTDKKRSPQEKPFTLLLSKFTLPEEIFGPISVQSLKDDRYVRLTQGFFTYK